MATSKIKSIQASGTYENVNGTDLGNGKKGFYQFIYEFEDGTVMQASHKTKEPPFQIGDTAEYEVKRTHETYGKSGKVSKPQNNGSSKGGWVPPDQEAILFQVCLKEANLYYATHGFGDELHTDVATTENKLDLILGAAFHMATKSQRAIKALKEQA